MGAKTAERVPTTTRASPRRIRCHCSARSSGVSCECRRATSEPKAATICAAVAGVRPISGTRRRADLLLDKARCMAAT